MNLYRNAIPPTTTVAALLEKYNATIGKICVDIGFWGGIVPGNQNELIDLLLHGVIGFKCFLCPSGDEYFPHVTDADVDLACKILQSHNALISVRNFLFS